MKAGIFPGLIADYGRAVQLDPDYAEAYNDRAFVKNSTGDTDGALADYSRAIELKPSDAKYYNNRGVVRAAKGELDQAQLPIMTGRSSLQT